jgi:hypothetical protein
MSGRPLRTLQSIAFFPGWPASVALLRVAVLATILASLWMRFGVTIYRRAILSLTLTALGGVTLQIVRRRGEVAPPSPSRVPLPLIDLLYTTDAFLAAARGPKGALTVLREVLGVTGEQPDDITLLMIQWPGPAAPKELSSPPEGTTPHRAVKQASSVESHRRP